MLWKLERQSPGLLPACMGHKEQEGPSLLSLPPREGECSISPAKVGGPDLLGRGCHTPCAPSPVAEAALTFSLLTVAQGASLTTKPLDGALDSSCEDGFIYTCIASLSTTSASCSDTAQLGADLDSSSNWYKHLPPPSHHAATHPRSPVCSTMTKQCFCTHLRATNSQLMQAAARQAYAHPGGVPACSFTVLSWTVGSHLALLRTHLV